MSGIRRKRDPAIDIATGRKSSVTISRKAKEGTWHTSLAKDMHYNYNGIDLHGTWELQYAKWLDANKIK